MGFDKMAPHTYHGNATSGNSIIYQDGQFYIASAPYSKIPLDKIKKEFGSMMGVSEEIIVEAENYEIAFNAIKEARADEIASGQVSEEELELVAAKVVDNSPKPVGRPKKSTATKVSAFNPTPTIDLKRVNK